MRRALALVTILSLGAGGCGFAVRHPAVTASLVGGSLALATCELAVSDHQSCLVGGAAAGALLGLVAAGALWLGGTDESILQPAPEAPPIRRRPAQARPAAAPPVAVAPAAPAVIPDYLVKPPELYVPSHNNVIIPAPAEDQAVAASYARSPVRGPLHEGARITILSARTTYKVGEEVRVIHVFEAPEPGRDLYVMGPKDIRGEYVDGVERTRPATPADGVYDGVVLRSPGVDFNYEITVYKLTTPGPHKIQWRHDGRVSNVLELDVAP